MKNTTARERAALHAITEYASAEDSRAALWSAVSLADKTRAMMIAGLDKHRAGDPLAAFSQGERRVINLALAVHCDRMTLLASCVGGVESSPTFH